MLTVSSREYFPLEAFLRRYDMCDVTLGDGTHNHGIDASSFSQSHLLKVRISLLYRWLLENSARNFSVPGRIF